MFEISCCLLEGTLVIRTVGHRCRCCFWGEVPGMPRGQETQARNGNGISHGNVYISTRNGLHHGT